MQSENYAGQLHRGLKNRHIQLIALGGAVGTGLFFGVAYTIHMTGPSVLLGYAIAGFIALLIMRQLGEMVVEEPVAGSFSHFAYKYWSKFAGYLSGWNYWVLFILVGMTELTACGTAIQYWWSDIPIWLSVAGLFIFVNAINLLAVKFYGEAEFWFAIIKVTAIMGIILFGCYLLLSGNGGQEASVTNLWRFGGFFANGVESLVMAMAIIMFSFGGLELVGITAAEATDPEKNIPKATNQVLWRILIFYIGSITVLLCLYPWTNIVVDGKTSPFVMMFQSMDSQIVAAVIHIVVFTAALSAYNSSVYCTSRMLYALAEQESAPKALNKVSKRGVPIAATLASACATVICVLINYFVPENALQLLMALVVSSLVLNWIMISFTHLKFRQAMDKAGKKTKFKALLYPFGNYLCLLFLATILVIMYITPAFRMSVVLIPVWIGLLSVGYWLMEVSKRRVLA